MIKEFVNGRKVQPLYGKRYQAEKYNLRAERMENMKTEIKKNRPKIALITTDWADSYSM